MKPIGEAARHIPALDGVRGLAILFVILFHARQVFLNSTEMPDLVYQLLGLTWSGVDLFFVLSGFLITGILLDNSGSPSYFRTFYSRRILRIFPLYFVYLFLILVIVRALFRHFLRTDEWPFANTWWYLAYLQNWKPDHGGDDRYLQHLWSLAIEEQFYLIWPAVLWLVPRKRLAPVTLAIAAASLAARCYLGSRGLAGEALYRLTPTHMDSLALGAFVCVAVRTFRERLERWVTSAFLLAAPAFVLIAVAKPSVWVDPWVRTAGASLLAVAYACIVFRSSIPRDDWMHRFFSSSWLRNCGKYSYGMYVWHAAAFSLTLPYFQRVTSHGWPWALAISVKYLYPPLLVMFAYAIARLSWLCLEQPFLRLKRYAPYRAGPSVREQSAVVRPPDDSRLPLASL